jgi:hypothetical protein
MAESSLACGPILVIHPIQKCETPHLRAQGHIPLESSAWLRPIVRGAQRMADIEVYRGGSDLTAQPDDVDFDPQTGLVIPRHGVSVSSRPDKLARFGGPYRVTNLPPELEIVQSGRNRHHYEIIPRRPMTFEDYQKHLDQIVLEPVPRS